MKEVVGCVQDVEDNRKLLFKLVDRHKRDISAYLVSCTYQKEEVGQELHKTIFNLPKNKIKWIFNYQYGSCF